MILNYNKNFFLNSYNNKGYNNININFFNNINICTCTFIGMFLPFFIYDHNFLSASEHLKELHMNQINGVNFYGITSISNIEISYEDIILKEISNKKDLNYDYNSNLFEKIEIKLSNKNLQLFNKERVSRIFKNRYIYNEYEYNLKINKELSCTPITSGLYFDDLKNSYFILNINIKKQLIFDQLNFYIDMILNRQSLDNLNYNDYCGIFSNNYLEHFLMKIESDIYKKTYKLKNYYINLNKTIRINNIKNATMSILNLINYNKIGLSNFIFNKININLDLNYLLKNDTPKLLLNQITSDFNQILDYFFNIKRLDNYYQCNFILKDVFEMSSSHTFNNIKMNFLEGLININTNRLYYPLNLGNYHDIFLRIL